MGTVSPLDPEIFYGIGEYVAAESEGSVDARYRPTEVADWFDGLAAEVESKLTDNLANLEPDGRRLVVDARLQALLGHFLAAKFRASLYYERFRLNADGADAAFAAEHAETALEYWQKLSDLGAATYSTDIGFGRPGHLSGSWSTRLARVADNARALRNIAERGGGTTAKPFLPSRRPENAPEFKVVSADTYVVGKPFDVSIEAPGASDAFLHVRAVDHSAEFVKIPMDRRGTTFTASIDRALTAGDYDIIYFFSLEADRVLWLLPGLGPDLSARPYILARGRNGQDT